MITATIDRRAAGQARVSMALAVPAVLVLGGLFVWPVLRLLAQSLEGGSLQWYEKALSESLYLQVYWTTLRIAAIVTGLAVLLSWPIALLLATTSRGWRTVGFIFVLLPLWTSVLVRTYAWMVLLGRNGIINRWLLEAGLIERPLPLLHNELGVIIGMVHVLMPFAILPIYSAITRIDPSLSVAARGLGARDWSIFRHVLLPLALPGVIAGGLLVFILSLGFFITPALLGGGRVIMIAMVIEQQVREFLNWSFGGALSVVLLIATLAIYGGVQALAGRVRGAT